jgi:hypothetical protein
MFTKTLDDYAVESIKDLLTSSDYKSIVRYMTICLSKHHEYFKQVMENPRNIDANFEMDCYYQRIGIIYDHVFKNMPEMYDDFTFWSGTFTESLEKF